MRGACHAFRFLNLVGGASWGGFCLRRYTELTEFFRIIEESLNNAGFVDSVNFEKFC